MEKHRTQHLSQLHSFETSKDQPLCETCYTTLHFNLVSDRDHHKIDLKTVLDCLELAQKQQSIPMLDPEWWNQVRSNHG